MGLTEFQYGGIIIYFKSTARETRVNPYLLCKQEAQKQKTSKTIGETSLKWPQLKIPVLHSTDSQRGYEQKSVQYMQSNKTH